MAAPNLTSGERMDVYRLMFLLNRSFHRVVQHLEEIGKAQMLNSRDLRDALGLTQELQLEINTMMLNPLETMENDDWAHFGKVRIALEKRLKGEKVK